MRWLTSTKEELEENILGIKETIYEQNLSGYLQLYCDFRNANAEKFKYGTEKAKNYMEFCLKVHTGNFFVQNSYLHFS